MIGFSENTAERGLAELEDWTDDPAAGRIRRLGKGRKKEIEAKSVEEENLMLCFR